MGWAGDLRGLVIGLGWAGLEIWLVWRFGYTGFVRLGYAGWDEDVVWFGYLVGMEIWKHLIGLEIWLGLRFG